MRKAISPLRERLPCFRLALPYCFFGVSLDEPVPALGWSLELELEDDGEDGAGVGVGVMPLLLELEEPGEDGDVELVLPLPAGRSIPVVVLAPRSHAAIRLAPRARETATARV
jgi:hypothetical protein